jgi:protein-tyrosine phosphatase
VTDRPAVLFVCLGNICRSPLAETAFRAAAAAAGLEADVDSAGTGDWHAGEPPDPRARAIARAKGHDIDGLRARPVVPEDFTRFTHIVALDHRNLQSLERMRPAGSPARLGLLLDHVPGRAGEAVADPYYGGADGFETTWAEVSAGAEGLVRALRSGR